MSVLTKFLTCDLQVNLLENNVSTHCYILCHYFRHNEITLLYLFLTAELSLVLTQL